MAIARCSARILPGSAMDNAWYHARSPDYWKVKVPFVARRRFDGLRPHPRGFRLTLATASQDFCSTGSTD